MTLEQLVGALPGPEVGRRCAEAILGGDGGDPARDRFAPSEDRADALRLVERLAGVDFVRHRRAGPEGGPALWLAWFGDAAQATAGTAALATCRAALLYALGRGGARRADGPGAPQAPHRRPRPGLPGRPGPA
jgi:hypothetical protein